MKLFWGNSGSIRGMAFFNKNTQVNVHYIDLFFMRGYTVRIKLKNFRYAWKTLFRMLTSRSIL